MVESTSRSIRVLRKFFGTYWGIALLLAVGWQLLLLIVSVALEAIPGSGHTMLSHMSWWDGGWYLSILNGSYADPASPSPVFYPLFPFIVHMAQLATIHMINVLALGLVINTLALWLTLVALRNIVEMFAPGKYAWWAVGLFLASPVALYMHMFYAEAIFCALVFWAYLFALHRRWAAMAILLGLATATRLPAVLFVLLCGLEFMRAYGWRVKAILNPNLLWFLIAPFGFIAYGMYLQLVRGDFLAMFHGYHLTQDWTYHVFNPNFIHTILKEVYAVFLVLVGPQHMNEHVIVSSVLPLIGLAILLAASLYALFVMKGRGMPLGIFGLASLIFFTINNNTVSVHRYLLPCLSIYVVAALVFSKFNRLRPAVYGFIGVSIVTQIYLINLFVNGRFAG